ncbi:DEAD/DEAH box helicase [Peribacillus kribbensis]|uniref:DEAD/DEAH box helicase n=1 Tax=Peribacillus kribbensis TaxID=356658 RepID=UPI00040CDC12|nr:DEAD/DEAH box helicase [Peribacillus kribbensis]
MKIHLKPLIPFSFSTELQIYLTGRALPYDELTDFHPILEKHITSGYVGWMDGLSQGTCHRCGNTESHLFGEMPCSRCGKTCTYCRKCIMMGRVNACSRLHVWTGPHLEYLLKEEPLKWSGKLSPQQAEASRKAIEAVKTHSILLIWAVCGAGKTEILFEAIAEAIHTGKRVCLAAPRTDVVLELGPRLKAAFPGIEIAVLYGGSEDRHHHGQLVISTTHQLYRYRDAFDLMIIDEVDAFPFSGDPSLEYAAQKSRRETSSLIYLTATPSSEFKARVKKGVLDAAIIPARYHRHSIPVPELSWCGNWEKSFAKKTIPKAVSKWLAERLQFSTPFLLFFPNIKIMEEALPLFQRLHPDIQYVHAEDPNRKEKVQSLRENKVPGLLTTTILERGVTIPRLEAAVLGTEKPIFTESALVQIAGRVGRSADHPTGNISFFHYGKTEEMLDAVSHIKQMNAEAKRRDLIVE